MRRLTVDAAMRAVLPCVFTCSLAAPSVAQFHSDEGENFHNTTFIKVDDQARDHLLEATLAEESGDLEKAGQSLRRLLLSDVDSLLPQGERMFRDAREVAALKLASLGEPALEQYRKLTDEPSRAALRAALKPPSTALLMQVVLSYPLSPARVEALEALGDIAFESGRAQAAAFYYRMLLRTPGLPAERMPTIKAKALLTNSDASDLREEGDSSTVRVAGQIVSFGEVK